MARKVTTLTITDSALCLLVMKGKQVKKWASAPLEPGLVSQGLVLDEVRLADKLKELFKLKKVGAKKISVGLSGHGSLYRIVSMPELPNSLLPEAVKHEAKRVLPVPLDEVYLWYHPIYAPSGERRVILVTLRRNIMDALLRTLRRVGVKPRVLDLAPLALCRMLNGQRAIIVNSDLEQLDIVVAGDGLPQLVHSLSLPGRDKPAGERLPAITDELNRAVAFYNSSHSEQPLDTAVPIFVCGQLADMQEGWKSLIDGSGHSVSLLPSPVGSTLGFPVYQFAVNVAVALRDLSPKKGRGKSLAVDFNFLSAVRRRRVLPFKQILASTGVVAAIGLLVYTGFIVRDSTNYTVTLRYQLAPIERQVAQHQKEIASVQDQIKVLETAESALGTTLADLNNERQRVTGDLTTAVSLLPTGVKLTGINYRGGVVTVSGVAPNEADVLRYVRSLTSSSRFATVLISTIEERTKKDGEKTIKDVTFSLLLTDKGGK